ncbi:hypothetical protein [Candidatus Spongiihabitans sp.]
MFVSQVKYSSIHAVAMLAFPAALNARNPMAATPVLQLQCLAAPLDARR